jgi:hypothetical protein
VIDHEFAELTRRQSGTARAGWYSFQPLFDWVAREDPDLFE